MMGDQENKTDKEQLELSALYKRAYNDAELVINQFPDLINQLERPKGEQSDYTKGFEDRINEHRKVQELMKDNPYQRMNQRYGVSKGNPEKPKGIGKDDRN
ncbi:hypothetical protein [Roseivirga pacifica]|uniref:hypothetical protein n=1 Tax=Roseivirga pacifica TaxID=1267423 RepID=UPI003BB0426C